MARVRDIPSTELPPDLAATYERFASAYGPFRNQVAVFAHVPQIEEEAEVHAPALAG